MFLISELRHKDIINESDGKKLGNAYDIELDVTSGQLQALILPGESRFLGLFIRSEDIVIPWKNIRKIGLDVILIGENHELPAIEKATPAGGSFSWDDWEL